MLAAGVEGKPQHIPGLACRFPLKRGNIIVFMTTCYSTGFLPPSFWIALFAGLFVARGSVSHRRFGTAT